MPVQVDRSLWVVPLAHSFAINWSMRSSSTGLLEERMLSNQSLKKRNDKMLKYLQMKTSLALAVWHRRCPLQRRSMSPCTSCAIR